MILRFILGLFLISIVVIGLTIGWTVLNFKYLGPRQHDQNTQEAELFNQRTWETGSADIYYLEVKINVNGEVQLVSFEVVCALKRITENISLKNDVMSYTRTQTFGSRYRYHAISNQYRVEFDVYASCDGLANDTAKLGLPFELPALNAPALQLLSEPTASCLGHLSEGLYRYRFNSIMVSPLTVQSVQQAPVHDVLTREEYGAADAAITRERARQSQVSPDRYDFAHFFHWEHEHMCWWDLRNGLRSNCSSLGQRICEPNL